MTTTATDTKKIVTITINGELKYCTMSLYRDLHPSLVSKGGYDDIADNYVLNRLCCGTLKPIESNDKYTLLKATCGGWGGLEWYVIMNNRAKTSCLEFEVVPTCEVHLDGNDLVLTFDPANSGGYKWSIGEYEFRDTKTYNIYRVDHCAGLVNDIDTNFPLMLARQGRNIYIAEKKPLDKDEWTSYPIYCNLLHDRQ